MFSKKTRKVRGERFNGTKNNYVSADEFFVPASSNVRPKGEDVPVKRLHVFFAAAVMLLAVLALRGAYLQTSHAIFKTKAQGNRVRKVVEYAPRGIMLDKNGKQLVQNVPSIDLIAYPVRLPRDIEKLIRELQKIFPNVKAEKFKDTLLAMDKTSTEPAPVLANITHDQMLAVMAKSKHLPGMGIEERAVREYAGDQSLAHLIGYTGRITKEELKAHPEYLLTDILGKSGLESEYERFLRGVHGESRVEVDASGIVQGELGTVSPQPGTNLRLNVDLALQKKIFEILSKKLEEVGVNKGAVVAIDPRNGAVRALVSIPTYNHTELAQGVTSAEAKSLFSDPDQPLLNRVTQGQYPPGSTFKLAVAIGALEEGIIDSQTVINSTGGITIGSWYFPDWKAGGHGPTDIVKAIAESVNTFFYTIGGGYEDFEGMGIEKITAWAERLGYGSKTNIDLPGEKNGFLPSPAWKEENKGEPWYIGDTYHTSIGQGNVLVTPLQLAVTTSAIANGGTIYEPRLIDALIRNDGSVVEDILPQIKDKNIFSSHSGNLVQKGMREAVLSGSAQALSDLPVAVAGKTGTAQTGKEDKTHAWFTAYAPYEEPRLVLSVLVEEGGAGDEVAAPVAKEILKWHFKNN